MHRMYIYIYMILYVHAGLIQEHMLLVKSNQGVVLMYETNKILES